MMRNMRKKKIVSIKGWRSQNHLKQMSQAQDAKQTVNGRQPIDLLSCRLMGGSPYVYFFSHFNFSHLCHIAIPFNNFFLLLFSNSRLGSLFLRELHNLSFSKKLKLCISIRELFQSLTTGG